MSEPPEPFEIFVSSSSRDRGLREELEAHLALLRQQGLIRLWHESRIGAGADREREIRERLDSAGMILLLVSPWFMASADRAVEVERAMERHRAGETRVVPVILRPVDWRQAPFGGLRALPPNEMPVTSWTHRDEALHQVVQGLRAAIEAERTRRPRPAAPPRPPPAEAPPPAGASPAAAPRFEDSGPGSAAAPPPATYQSCFIYNPADEAQVEEVARGLAGRGLKLWLRKWEVRPGSSAVTEFAQSLARSDTMTVFVGANGLAPWDEAQYQAALRRAVEQDRRLIPVLLPSVRGRPELPVFLANYEWVEMQDLRGREALARLEWGITGVKPDDLGY